MRRVPARRLVSLFSAFILCLALVTIRLVFLQVRDASAYSNAAYLQRVRTIPLAPTRGAILDRFGHDLALSLGAKDVYADPRYVTDPAGEAQQIATILKVKAMPLQQAMSQPNLSFVYLARQVDATVAAQIQKLNLPGIGFLDESKRYYPSGQYGAPQVLGFVNMSGQGAAGLELQYNSLLTGKAGQRTEEVDPQGNPIPQGVDHYVAPVNGSSIVTTIDPQLQYQAEVALQQAVKSNGAKGGTVIMMQPGTGDILAMASYPWFDPNKYATYPMAQLNTPALQYVYEPGSVNKVITASAAVQEGKVSLKQRITVPGSLSVAGSVIHDAEPHGTEMMTLNDILTVSSNIGTTEIAQKLGPNLLAEYLAKFGFGQYTGLNFPGESAGILPPEALWSGTSLATISFGQGLAVTPIQMANVYATIANGGVWVQPQLVRGTVDPNGVFHAAPPPVTRRVVSTQTASTVTDILAHAVEVGTGTAAQVPGYWAAGKTGTSQVPNPKGGYYNKYDASFIGFLPAEHPQVVIAVILDEPATQWGGVASAPVFQRLGEDAIAQLNIAPASKPPSLPTALKYP
jgi:cell division protein FtsI (penicillin-binding protein 3)